MATFTLKDVQDWVLKHDGITGALRWFEAYAPNNAFYQKVAKPLLSIRTTGSIDVERAVKPIKGCVLTKQRNRLSNNKAIVLFRLSENLRQLQNIKVEMKMSGKKFSLAKYQVLEEVDSDSDDFSN